MGVSKGKILIADDEAGMRESLGILFRRHGYEVAFAETVRDGLEAVQSDFFDVVVTDMLFPDGNGLEIMAYCRRYCPKTKVIAMTGHASLDSAIESLRIGAYDYVVKPFDFELLLFSVEKAMRHQMMEDEIRSSEERYRSLIEELNDGYLVIDRGKIVYANKTMCRLLQCDAGSLLGKDFFDFVDQASRPRLEENLRFLHGGERFLVSDEVALRNVRGEKISCEIKFSTSVSSKQPGEVVVICRDVSEMKSLWDKLIKQEKLAVMGEMVAGIAHELNNKLTPILGYVEMLSQKNPEEEINRPLELIHNAALGAKNIVESLLLFARQEKPRKEPCDVNEMLRVALDLVSPSFRTSFVEVKMDLHKELPKVMADRHQVEQVLVNIIKNAFEAMPGGGEIIIKSFEKEGDVMITISDTGPGVPNHIMAHIFDPFFTTKDRGKGSGMGLSICHGIIREHGGDIAVSSDGPGATFCIRLPAAADEDDLVPVPLDSIELANGYQTNKKILVVEDEPEIAQLLKEVLSINFKTVLARNGEEALEKLESDTYDLIVSDVKMPGLNGIGLYEQLQKRCPEYCKRIVFTTGVTFDKETQEFLNETGVPCIRKPFKINEILNMARRMISQQENHNSNNHLH